MSQYPIPIQILYTNACQHVCQENLLILWHILDPVQQMCHHLSEYNFLSILTVGEIQTNG